LFNVPETVYAYISTYSGWPCHARWQFIGRALVWRRLARAFCGRGQILYTDLVLPVCLKSLDRRQAGRIFNRPGVTDLFADLQHSCEYRCALVVAILRVVAEITGLRLRMNQNFEIRQTMTCERTLRLGSIIGAPQLRCNGPQIADRLQISDGCIAISASGTEVKI
jgi:hypothetical protein